jgi:hypothetical protein
MSSSTYVDAYVCDSTMFLEKLSQDLRQMLDDFRSGYHEQYPHQYCEYINRLISFKTKIRDFQKQGKFYYILKYHSGYDEDEHLWKYALTNHNLLSSLLVRSYIKNPSPYAKKDDISPDAEVVWAVVTSGITDIAEAATASSAVATDAAAHARGVGRAVLSMNSIRISIANI